MAYAGKAFDHLGIILHTGQSAAGPSVAGCRVLAPGACGEDPHRRAEPA